MPFQHVSVFPVSLLSGSFILFQNFSGDISLFSALANEKPFIDLLIQPLLSHSCHLIFSTDQSKIIFVFVHDTGYLQFSV